MEERKKGLSKGCLIAMIVVGVIIIGAVVLSLLCISNPEKLIALGLNPIMDEIKENLPDGIYAEDVDKYRDDFLKAFKEGKINEAEIQVVLNKGKDLMSQKDVGDEEFREASKEFLDEIQNAIDN